jgi:hypothetical protein
MDEFVPSAATDFAAVRVRHRYVVPQRILSEALAEDTDVYENRVLLGFCESLGRELETIRRRTQTLVAGLVDSPPSTDREYIRFQELGAHFARAFSKKLGTRIDRLEADLGALRDVLEKQIPVRVSLPQPPQLTPGFRRYEHYRLAFDAMHEWYGHGAAAFSAEAFLLGLKSLDRLFEFYCLVRLIDGATSLGYVVFESRHDASGEWQQEFESRPANTYLLKRSNGDGLIVHYEPEIRSIPGAVPLHDTHHRHDGRDSRWTPDYVLEFIHDDVSSFVILDAKYMREKGARDALPKMALKYLHGISGPLGAARGAHALCMLYAGRTLGKATYYSYHARPFGLSDSTPVRPAIGALQLAPGRPDELESILKGLERLCQQS